MLEQLGRGCGWQAAAPERGAGAPRGVRALASAARPRTLPAAVAPVLVGTAVAAAEGMLRPLAVVASFAVALLLQVAANWANDLFDFEKGADTAERIGPPRATQQGWVTPAQMRIAVAAALVAAAVPGLFLVALGGWPIALTGALAMLAALAYTGGPRPLGYIGLGEVAVFLFFGAAAVCGTVWVHAGALPPAAMVACVAPGALASAILVVNNLRDVDTDRVAHKRTLAVRFGAGAARREYAALLGLAFATPIALFACGLAPVASLAPLVTLPWAVSLGRRVASREGSALNPLLGETARLELVFCLLFAAGLLA